MAGAGVVGAVHGDGDGVVVDGHVRVAVDPGPATACAASAGEQVNVQFAVEG